MYDEFIFVKLLKSFFIFFVHFWTINSFSVHWKFFIFELKAKVGKMLRIFNVRFIFIYMFIVIFDNSFIRSLFNYFCFLIASVFFHFNMNFCNKIVEHFLRFEFREVILNKIMIFWQNYQFIIEEKRCFKISSKS